MTLARLLTPTVLALALLTTPSLFSQTSARLEERNQLWLGIRDTMRGRIDQLGEYTCIQNIIRFEKTQDEKHERAVDTIRMQVSAVGGNESYSWPGSPNSSERPSDLLRTGLMGTGSFQGYIRALFVSPGPAQIEFLGRTSIEGQRLLHFRFTFDLRERLILNVAAGRASVAAKGEFWADEQDRTVRRMRIENTDPAPEINVKSVEYFFEWAPVLLHGRETLLPQMASMRMETYSGEVRRNEIALSQCREFRADSTVRFDGPPGDVEAVPASPGNAAAGFLPADLTVPIRLLSAIQTETSAVGDIFEAEVTRDVKSKGETLLRKGDRAEGRIRYLARYQEPELHTLLWLEISSVKSGGREYVFLGELARKPHATNLIQQAQGFTEGRLERIGVMGAYRIDRREYRSYGSVPGVASFLFRGGQANLPAGYEMEWTTLPARAGDGR